MVRRANLKHKTIGYEVVMNGETPHTPLAPEGDGDISTAKCESIKACLDSYLQKNPKLSLQSIDDKTGIPISTLRRIINLNGNPNPESVIKLCRALGFDQELEKYLEKYHPDIAALMASKSHNKDYEYVPENETEYFTDDSSFLILSFAYTTIGTTEEVIRFELGERGIVKLNELCDKGLLLRTENGRYIGKISNFKLPFAAVRKRIDMASKYYRLDEAGGDNNFLNYQAESLNLEGLKKLKSVEKDQAIYRREWILNNPIYHGEFPIFIATISSTFLPYNGGPEVLQ